MLPKFTYLLNTQKDWTFKGYLRNIDSHKSSKSSALSVIIFTIQFSKFYFWKFENLEKSSKNTTSFSEKTRLWLADSGYDLYTFHRHSSEYLQRSVLSPKRFGWIEIKLKQKAYPPKKVGDFLGGVRSSGSTKSDLREVCAKR